MKFYNRKREIETLQNLKKDFRIAVIGRRRVGKTRLVEQSYKESCLAFFIPAEKSEKETIAGWNAEYNSIYMPPVETFKDFFEFMFSQHKDKVIFIDELQNGYKVNKSFISDLQHLIDKYKPKLVVSGSLISMMRSLVEDYKSPIYGRFDLIIKLKELDLKTVHEICADLNMSIEDALILYSVFGGIPKYYELMEKVGKFNLMEFVLDSFVRYPKPLYEEVKTMLKEEFGKEYKTFFSILSAIAGGKNKHSEIAGCLGRKQTAITKYLAMLKNDFEFIKRELPVIGGKKGVYKIQNNIILFWFSNVWKYEQMLETEPEEKVVELIKNNFNSYIASVFESSVLELFNLNYIPFEFTRIGRQWGRIPDAPKDKNQYEIDICAINEKNKNIMFAECKWSDKADAKHILEELKKKATYINWHANERKEHYFIFAKSFKEKFKEENVHLYDLKDIEKAVSK